MGVGVQRHALPLGKRPGTHFIGSLLGPRAGLEGRGKSRPHWDSILGPPARSESLYQLHRPAQ
jgi:hypothetical protein